MELKDIYGMDTKTYHDDTPVKKREERKVTAFGDSKIQDVSYLTNGSNVMSGTQIGHEISKTMANSLQKTEINPKRNRLGSEESKQDPSAPTECTVCMDEAVSILAYPCCHLCM